MDAKEAEQLWALRTFIEEPVKVDVSFRTLNTDWILISSFEDLEDAKECAYRQSILKNRA